MKNVCIVGCGAISGTHADALSKIEEAHIVSVCDIVPERADRLAAKCGAKAYYSLEAALADSQNEYYHICTPHYLHCKMISSVLDAGKCAVTEKPAVMTKEELSVMASWDRTRVFYIFQNRHNNAIKALLSDIDGTVTGKLLGIKANHTWNRGAAYYNSGAWRGKWATEGGGVLINQSIHTLDLALLVGGDVKTVSAVMQNNSLKGVIEVEDTASVFCRFSSGATLNFFATNANAVDSAPFIEYYFENATYRYDNYSLYKNGVFLAADSPDAPGKACWGAGHEAEFAEIYGYGRGADPGMVTGTLKTVFAAYESAKAGGKEILL